MNKLNELIEWMEGELDVVKKNNAAAYLYRCGVADTLERNITKAKELEAANCDHKDCRNSGKDLRQELIEKGYDMNQYPDQVTDHDRASTDQVPDKSYPAKTPEQIAAELYPDYKNGNDTVIPKPINHEQAAKRAAWLSRQPEVDELKRQVEELKSVVYRAGVQHSIKDDEIKQLQSENERLGKKKQ